MNASFDFQSDEIQSLTTSILALAKGLVQDEALAEDLVQETWLAALNHPPHQGRNVFPWFATVLRNFARRHFRGETTRSRYESQLSESPREVTSTDDLVESSETIQILIEELRRLPEPMRSAVMLRYFRDLNSFEIAKSQGIAPSSARERLGRGLTLLRQRLDERHDGSRRNWCQGLIGTYGIDALVRPATLTLIGGKVWAIAAAGILVAVVTWRVGSLRQDAETSPSPGVVPSSTQVGPALDSVTTSPIASEAQYGSRTEAEAHRIEDRKLTERLGRRLVPSDQALVQVRVQDALGSPLPGAVLAWLEDPSRRSATDAEGRAHVSIRPSASNLSALFTLSCEGFATGLLSIPVRVGRSSPAHDTQLIPSFTVRGQVLDESGKGVADACVFAAPDDGGGLDEITKRHGPSLWTDQALPHGRTDHTGRFVLEKVPKVPVRLWACGETTFFGVSAPVRHAESGLEDVPVIVTQLGPAARIRGTVATRDHEPVGDAIILCSRSTSDSSNQSRRWPSEYPWLSSDRLFVTDEYGHFDWLTRFNGDHDLVIESDTVVGDQPIAVRPGGPVFRLVLESR